MNGTTNAPSSEIPYGYCHCGCGQKTEISKYTNKKTGWVKGEPRRYILGHFNRTTEPHIVANPSGLCMCGCGQKTPLADRTSTKKGWYKGEPLLYIFGHQCVIPIEKMFWDRVDKRSDNECWHWTGTILPNGYGRLSHAGKNYSAHRVSYTLNKGKIHEGMVVCHKCDNPRCVNPSHLFLGTYADNTADMIAKGRQANGERQPQSKLTEQDIIRIRSICASGRSHKSVAREFGVSSVLIDKIVNRKAWKHVP